MVEFFFLFFFIILIVIYFIQSEATAALGRYTWIAPDDPSLTIVNTMDVRFLLFVDTIETLPGDSVI